MNPTVTQRPSRSLALSPETTDRRRAKRSWRFLSNQPVPGRTEEWVRRLEALPGLGWGGDV